MRDRVALTVIVAATSARVNAQEPSPCGLARARRGYANLLIAYCKIGCVRTRKSLTIRTHPNAM
jgi:hypothetical protein